MTAPLDEKAIEAAIEVACRNAGHDPNSCAFGHGSTEGFVCDVTYREAHRNGTAQVIRAYLAASPSPSEMEASAWEGYWPGAGSISSTTKLTKDKNTAARWQDDGAEIEPLVTISQAQSALAAMRAERDEAKGKLALIVDRIVYSDSYGVPGSDFQCCHLCNGGGAPGVPFEHEEMCPVRHVERDYEQWFDDIRATEDALRETEERASAAEAQVLRLTEENEALRFAHKSMADFVRPRIPEGQNVEQAESFLAWIGMIVRLEERGDKALARADAAEARIKALEEALRPFADEAKELAAGVPDNAVYALADFPDLGLADFIVRDLRRANAALSQGGGE